MKTKNLTFIFIAFLLISTFSSRAQSLESGFVNPPDSARPWVYWFWLNGNISKEGITADLEAMKSAGIGGVLIMEVDQGTPKGKYVFGSPEWQDIFKFMLTEANRLGLKVNMCNDAGWCGSGGPWVTVDKSMQKITWSEVNVEGPKQYTGMLEKPKSVNNYYEDIMALAYPTPEGEGEKISDYSPEINSSSDDPAFDGKKVIDNDLSTKIVLPRPDSAHPQYLELVFPQPYTSHVLTLYPAWQEWPVCYVKGTLQISDDGKTYKTIADFNGGSPSITMDYPEVASKYYRLNFTEITREESPLNQISFAEIELTNTRISNPEEKAMFTPPQSTIIVPSDINAISAKYTIPKDQVIIISDKMKSDGSISWNIPKGKWTIMRIGHTTTGIFNHPAPEGGLGYECDKLSKDASTLLFNGLITKLANNSKDLSGKSFVSTHIDSWEIGSQNWTPGFLDEFQTRRGYNPISYIPALMGRIVDNVEISERFLWDWRTTISEMMLDNYVGNIKTLANQKGLRLSVEAYNRCMTNEMEYAGAADEPMGEFWSWPKFYYGFSCTEMTSAAHVYGKKIIGAEAFTANAGEKWQGYPGYIKDEGDWAFCEGINRFVFHRYAMQPYNNILPGISMGPWGLHYERTETWWKQSKAWHQYLTRCQFLLQQGLYVADICYLAPEAAPQTWFAKNYTNESWPDENIRANSSYNFDGCPAEAFINRATVKDGKIVFPDGMNYKVLVLPESGTMSPRLLKKISEMVEAGAVVIGKAPSKAVGLSGYPQSDEEVQKMVSQLWGNCDGISIKEKSFGKGKIICGKKPDEVLEEMSIKRDFQADKFIRFTHRVINNYDVYFVANPEQKELTANCIFRINGRLPEIWNPINGNIKKPAQYTSKNGVISMPIHFDPAGSAFIVFKPENSLNDNTIKSVSFEGNEINVEVEKNNRNGFAFYAGNNGKYSITTSDNKTFSYNISKLPAPVIIKGPWEVRFLSGTGAPEKTSFDSLYSWSQDPNEKIKYYSGSAVYSRNITITKDMIDKNRSINLDLGNVKVIAEVTVNGQNLGILWTKPYSVEITKAVKPGVNKLEIKVVNLWINRLIGDEQLPDESKRNTVESDPVWNPSGSLIEWPQWVLDGKADPSGRNTFTTWKLWRSNSPLTESGLLGPVKIIVNERIMVP
jgi:hypothetical protein